MESEFLIEHMFNETASQYGFQKPSNDSYICNVPLLFTALKVRDVPNSAM